HMAAQGSLALPSLRTIYRILCRTGLSQGRRCHGRRRPPPPPRGWYLPDLADRSAELDSFDIILNLLLFGRTPIETLNGVSLHGGLTASWPIAGPVTSAAVVRCLVEHWQRAGLPA